MECISEKLQCLTCDQEFPYMAKAHEKCEHLAASVKAPRRFVNPVFLGGALIMPPVKPGWSDADVTDVAANRLESDVKEWEETRAAVLG
jgi:hypothetical protein